MKVVIADDEHLPRAYLKSMIHELDLHAEIIGEAANGMELVELVKAFKPDIAFVDIKMPKLNGLEAITMAKEVSPQTQWVILSGFSEFEFAKEAIKLGVTNYLLKPVGIDDLRSVFSGLIKKSQELISIMNMEFERELTAYFYEISGYTKNARDSILHKSNFHSALFVIDSSLDEKSKSNSQSEFFHNLRALMEEYMDSQARLALFVLPSNNVIFVGASGFTEDPTGKEVVLRCMHRMTQFAVQSGSDDFYISVLLTEACESFDTLHKRIYQLQNLAPTRILQNTPKLSIHDLVRMYQNFPCDLLELANMLILLSMAFSEKNYLKYMKASDDIGKFLHKLRSSMDIQVMNAVQSFILHTLNLKTDLSDKPSVSLKHLHDKGQLLLIQSQKQENSSADIVSQVIKFIEQNYMNEISVNQISDQLNITASYLSSLFHKKTGTTFVKYLTRFRMLKAKELLTNPNSQVQQVAEQVGYFSTRHFTKLFVEYFNCNPSDYKKNSGKLF